MTLAGLLTLVLVLALIGFCVYMVITYIPMPAPFRTAIIVIVVIVLMIYLINLLLGGGTLKIGGNDGRDTRTVAGRTA